MTALENRVRQFESGASGGEVTDHNPMGLTVYHKAGTDAPGHDCRPRIYATCRGCRLRFNLCSPTGAEIKAIMRRGWRCDGCEVRHG